MRESIESSIPSNDDIIFTQPISTQSDHYQPPVSPSKRKSLETQSRTYVLNNSSLQITNISFKIPQSRTNLTSPFSERPSKRNNVESAPTTAKKLHFTFENTSTSNYQHNPHDSTPDAFVLPTKYSSQEYNNNSFDLPYKSHNNNSNTMSSLSFISDTISVNNDIYNNNHNDIHNDSYDNVDVSDNLNVTNGNQSKSIPYVEMDLSHILSQTQRTQDNNVSQMSEGSTINSSISPSYFLDALQTSQRSTNEIDNKSQKLDLCTTFQSAEDVIISPDLDSSPFQLHYTQSSQQQHYNDNLNETQQQRNNNSSSISDSPFHYKLTQQQSNIVNNSSNTNDSQLIGDSPFYYKSTQQQNSTMNNNSNTNDSQLICDSQFVYVDSASTSSYKSSYSTQTQNKNTIPSPTISRTTTTTTTNKSPSQLRRTSSYLRHSHPPITKSNTSNFVITAESQIIQSSPFLTVNSTQVKFLMLLFFLFNLFYS